VQSFEIGSLKRFHFSPTFTFSCSPALYLTGSVESSYLFRTPLVIVLILVTQYHLSVSWKTASCLSHIFILFRCASLYLLFLGADGCCFT
jgi:hypothetical protein